MTTEFPKKVPKDYLSLTPVVVVTLVLFVISVANFGL